jgi:hypothetical protein
MIIEIPLSGNNQTAVFIFDSKGKNGVFEGIRLE